MKDFRSLNVWKKAHELTLSIYDITGKFPQQEIHGLVSQVRRASSSIPLNIAEGCGCDGDREFARFLSIAFRSASETEYHIILAKDLGYIDLKTFEALNNKVTELKIMLTELIQKLKADY